MNINATVVYYSILNCSRARSKKQKMKNKNPNCVTNKKLLKSVKNSWFYVDFKMDTKIQVKSIFFKQKPSQLLAKIDKK